MRQRKLIPLPQLLSVGRESDLYNLSDSQKSFYAQSWAIVDWLLAKVPDCMSEWPLSDRVFSSTCTLNDVAVEIVA